MEYISPSNGTTSFFKQSRVGQLGAAARRVLVAALTSLLLLLPFGGLTLGQTVSPPSFTVKHTSPPPTIQWLFFLLDVNRNDRAALRLAVQGKDGAWLKNYRQAGLGFTDEQFQPIRATAQRLEAELKEIGGKMRGIELAHRPTGPRLPGTPSELKSTPPEWASLSQQRNSIVQEEISNLKNALGPDLSGTLGNYISSKIAPNVTTYHPNSGKEVQP